MEIFRSIRLQAGITAVQISWEGIRLPSGISATLVYLPLPMCSDSWYNWMIFCLRPRLHVTALSLWYRLFGNFNLVAHAAFNWTLSSWAVMMWSSGLSFRLPGRSVPVFLNNCVSIVCCSVIVNVWHCPRLLYKQITNDNIVKYVFIWEVIIVSKYRTWKKTL